jgi:NDP-sugar pyrophosphorylase family protein
VRRVVISCGYLAEVFEQQLGDGGALDLEITYAIEERALGRGGGIRFAASKLPASCQVFYTTNGDVLTNLDLAALERRRLERNAMAAIAVVPYESPFGVVELNADESLVRAFREKVRLPHWLNAGVYSLSREVVARLPEVGDQEDSTFPELAREHQLAALPAPDAYWRSIDSMKDLKLAADEVRERLPAAWREPLPVPNLS